MEYKRRPQRQLEGLEVHVVESDKRDVEGQVGSADDKRVNLQKVQQGPGLESSTVENDGVH